MGLSRPKTHPRDLGEHVKVGLREVLPRVGPHDGEADLVGR